MKNRLTFYILVGMVLGVIVGYVCHRSVADAAEAKTIAGYFSIITDIFLRLVKMIIAPLVFATLVSGLAGMEGTSDVRRIGFRSVGWFVCASLFSLALGLVLANALQPGAGLHMTQTSADVATGLNTAGLNFKDFVTHAFPSSIIDAMARNDILQILVFSVLFGVVLSAIKSDPRVTPLIAAIDALVPAMLKLTDYVMRLAPIGVFGALASAITVHGLDVLTTYGKLVGCFYLGLVLLWAALILVGHVFLGKSIWRLLKAVREPAMLAFSTASSEAAYPRLTEKLEQFGIDKKVVGFTLPLGYAFNLDGSMMYQAFAAIFIAQAFGIDMPLSAQIMMLLVLMLSSKGMAGVARGSVVVVAAVAPMFHLPPSGVVLILAIDQILDMGRTATNVIGNSIATAVIAKWEAKRVARQNDGENNVVLGQLQGETK
ncbi:Proton/glutamate-aspartate symporter [Paraburkholderia domus]|jgi:Na+/H+-dicarboxylate symporters|uniref:Proton/glutamate-aspartate symporter n=1 Tax=Paraburkholderia domus TaxID=2793075 RepID=A0A9N8R019_9BURK|nr:dicarboxylate/amino acid:cation symporter [Paraburkholderia domus]MBK5049519.1 dicarboxylate/amino acid:cation symporter [Burkholderia sp. R-70006]MBK5061918.1 dicarboxylate/amino acid:cation symporter [Burkholderia sp. R-70199]MBK5087171.1 dicarboxylate/amino acid:cation symporter [Burkholderia sp. R-69927]MBK5123526.1 dicarboxylate/amino acid:cation symporter [Burkholderia sp. R-69980]MBK5166758.1 dicarboxylate/amino acid:cation symporter [Burkholderia sp. R-70211]MBK5180894.1 dicarboxyl